MDTLIEWTRENTLISSLIIIVTVAYFTHRILYKRQNLPPGPLGLPIVGYLPFIIKDAPQKLYKLRVKYGDIISIYLGSRYTVILNDYSSIKEGLNDSNILARPPQMPFDLLNKIKYTKTGFGGKLWLEQRRFILHVLRDLGLGKNKMEEFIKEEISLVLKEFKRFNGEPLLANEILTPSVSNVIGSLVFGRRLEYNSKERKLLDHGLKTLGKFIGKNSFLIFIPWLRPLVRHFSFFNYKEAVTAMNNVTTFVKQEIQEHEMTLDSNNIRDYIDGYLTELKSRNGDDKSYFDEDMLIQTTQQLFGAGSGTVRESLSWAFLTMAKYPSVQKRVQQEIDNTIGKHRLPDWADHPKLPFTQAVIYELQRWKTIAPLNILRYCVKDTTVKSVKIPKGSIVLANIWAVHNDKNYWKDPEVFRPERFLDETGSKLIRHEFYIPFSYGRMSCPGEGMAKEEIFLYFTTILQNFTIKPPEGKDLDLEGNFGIVYISKPQKLHFVERE
ncbi:cytochrome P450 2F2-like [Centruroides sculpturatus]|uniref:cytochrome P450 2F2-like n=1 Tax=Centruroides sculpturatus TaxID=218467 RepID=UPI000C6D1645|nr:cytochrome P450 2F2-like [Centruroides sculpturatus]